LEPQRASVGLLNGQNILQIFQPMAPAIRLNAGRASYCARA
jgi:hypothetical protein